MNALAKRLVACNRWRWVRGMPDTTGRTFVEYADCGEALWLWAADDGCEHLPVEGRLPDLSDPGTLGHLLALVRKAWGLPGAYFRGGWVYNDNGGSPEDDGELAGENGMSEAEALVAALEAAP